MSVRVSVDLVCLDEFHHGVGQALGCGFSIKQHDLFICR